MRSAIDVFWESLRDWYNGMVGLATMNLVWLVTSLTVVLLPPATAGMYAVTNSIAHGTGGRFEDFIAGARQHLWISLRWALLNVLVGVVWFINFTFYSATESVPGLLIQSALGTAGILWLAVQFYVWPFLLEQEDKRLRIAFKNALFITLASPVYTGFMLFFVALSVVLSLVLMLPLAVFTMSFVSLLGNRAVVERLTVFGKLPSRNTPSSGEPL